VVSTPASAASAPIVYAEMSTAPPAAPASCWMVLNAAVPCGYSSARSEASAAVVIGAHIIACDPLRTR
jgi:hypothetical protein